jgi:membrane protein YdbS with pleckstrin-like domain
VGYIEKSLGPDETLIYKAHFHWLYYTSAWVILIATLGIAAGIVSAALSNDLRWAILLGGCAVVLVVLLRRMLPIWTTEIGVTNHRLIVKRGWLHRSTDELQLKAIEQVNLEQGMMGRVFDFGRVDVHGTGTDDIKVPAVASPLDFLKAVEGAASKMTLQPTAAPNSAPPREES